MSAAKQEQTPNLINDWNTIEEDESTWANRASERAYIRQPDHHEHMTHEQQTSCKSLSSRERGIITENKLRSMEYNILCLQASDGLFVLGVRIGNDRVFTLSEFHVSLLSSRCLRAKV